MREREERERRFCAEEGKGLVDALAFHNTVAVYWSDVRAQRSRTKRERKGGGGEGRKGREELKRTNEITIRSGGWIIPGGVC